MTTKSITRQPSEAQRWWGKQFLGVSVHEAALERIRTAYELFDHVFVGFSGGKDSTVVLNLTVEVARALGKLPVRAVFYDEECISYETEAYVRRTGGLSEIALEWYCLPVRHRNGCSKDSPFWWPWAPELRDRWVRPLPPEALVTLEGFPVEPADKRPSIPESNRLLAPYSRYGRAALVMGIRAQESMTRRRAVSNKREDNWLVPITTSLSKAYPIYDWRTQDVWTAPARLGWDYNGAYDVMEMAGISHPGQRLAPPFGEEPMGLLWMWSVCFPELWDRMCERVPGAAAAARYARTELYSYGEVTSPADEESWQEHIGKLIEKHPPDVRATVARNVRSKIRLHYRKTTDPILPTAPHPLSGVSWRSLAVLAERADLKARRTSQLHLRSGAPGSPEWNKAEKAYAEELAEWQRR